MKYLNIVFFGILFVSTINTAHATYYDNNYGYTYHGNNTQRYQLNKQNSDLKKTDYSQNTYQKIIKPYVGVEVLNTKRNFANDGFFKDDEKNYFRDSSFGGAAVLGLKAYKYFGFEGFYQRSFGEKKDNMSNISVPVDKKGHEVSSIKDENYDHDAHGKLYDQRTFLSSAYGIDFLGYLPLSQQLDLVASIGIGQYEFETRSKAKKTYESGEEGWYHTNNSYTYHKDFDSAGIRVGVGLQYTLDDMVAFRGMVRYVKLSKDEYVKDLIETSLGIYYLF